MALVLRDENGEERVERSRRYRRLVNHSPYLADQLIDDEMVLFASTPGIRGVQTDWPN